MRGNMGWRDEVRETVLSWSVRGYLSWRRGISKTVDLRGTAQGAALLFIHKSTSRSALLTTYFEWKRETIKALFFPCGGVQFEALVQYFTLLSWQRR